MYGLPNKTVKIDDEPLLVWKWVSGVTWDNVFNLFNLMVQNLFTKFYVLQTILVSLSMVYWFRVDTPEI